MGREILEDVSECSSSSHFFVSLRLSGEAFRLEIEEIAYPSGLELECRGGVGRSLSVGVVSCGSPSVR